MQPAQPPDGQAEALRSSIAKISAKIERIAELDRDPAIETVLRKYRKQRAQLQAQHAELKAANKARDDTIMVCATLRRDMEAMQRCLADKQQALQAASAEADQRQTELDALILEQRTANAALAASASPTALAAGDKALAARG